MQRVLLDYLRCSSRSPPLVYRFYSRWLAFPTVVGGLIYVVEASEAVSNRIVRHWGEVIKSMGRVMIRSDPLQHELELRCMDCWTKPTYMTLEYMHSW